MVALTKELEEMNTEGRTDADLTAARRARNELEMKVKDQVLSICCAKFSCMFDNDAYCFHHLIWHVFY